MTVTHRADIREGGDEGVRERRMLMAQSLDEARMESFIYLADTTVAPHGEIRLHTHRDVDIVTVMVTGRIRHRGSVGDGTTLDQNTIHVLRAGSGVQHDEVNPDAAPNRMLQMWFLPPRQGLEPGYQTFEAGNARMVSALGSDGAFENAARLRIARCDSADQLLVDEPCVLYIATGAGRVGDLVVSEGDLIEASSIAIDVAETMEAIVVTRSSSPSA